MNNSEQVDKIECLIGYLQAWEKGNNPPLELNDVIREAQDWVKNLSDTPPPTVIQPLGIEELAKEKYKDLPKDYKFANATTKILREGFIEGFKAGYAASGYSSELKYSFKEIEYMLSKFIYEHAPKHSTIESPAMYINKHFYNDPPQSSTSDESSSAEEAIGWTDTKPKFDREFSFATAHFIKDHWEYKIWQVVIVDGPGCLYYALCEGDGEEWGDRDELQAELYYILTEPIKQSKK